MPPLPCRKTFRQFIDLRSRQCHWLRLLPSGSPYQPSEHLVTVLAIESAFLEAFEGALGILLSIPHAVCAAFRFKQTWTDTARDGEVPPRSEVLDETPGLLSYPGMCARRLVWVAEREKESARLPRGAFPFTWCRHGRSRCSKNGAHLFMRVCEDSAGCAGRR